MLQPWVWLSCCLLTLGDALNCSVTGENDQTTYIISDLPQDSDCNWVYTWANSTNHVIANNKQQIDGLVLKNTNTTLLTSVFIEGIVFTGFTVSTGDRYVAHCQVTSTENARSRKSKESSGFTFPTAAIVAIVIFVLLVLSLVLLYIFRVKKILQLETCGCIYTAVKTADPDANV